MILLIAVYGTMATGLARLWLVKYTDTSSWCVWSCRWSWMRPVLLQCLTSMGGFSSVLTTSGRFSSCVCGLLLWLARMFAQPFWADRRRANWRNCVFWQVCLWFSFVQTGAHIAPTLMEWDETSFTQRKVWLGRHMSCKLSCFYDFRKHYPHIHI